MDETPPHFRRDFAWSTAPADPNDRLFAQLHTDEIKEASCLLLGLPFDGAVLGRKGAVCGPAGIRGALKNLKTFSYINGEVAARFHDLGDAQIAGIETSKAHSVAEAAARHVFKLTQSSDGRCTPLFFGGDHSLTYYCARPWLEKFGNALAVINLDAHLDVREVRAGQPFNSGTSFSRLMQAGLQHYVVIGARDFQTSPHYAVKARGAGAQIITANEVHAAKNAGLLARKILKSLPKEVSAIYLSIDMDVADASVAPGVSAPALGGLFAHQIFQLVREIGDDKRFVVCDIMELAPPLEADSDRTARLAATCVAELLAANGRRGRTT